MERKPREECFFGIHFDFHAAEDSTAVGEHTTREQIQSMLEVVRPEFVQCDCKGHPGVASFDSAIGTHAPGFARDNLGIWREVTREAGIPLFLHYSGILIWRRSGSIPSGRLWMRRETSVRITPPQEAVMWTG